jgi:predicted TIM-barrel fold metal-dependent hydrolase
MTVDFGLVDAERHFNDPDDCFTRHLEPAFADRSVHVVRDDDGGRSWYFGNRPLTKARPAPTRMLRPGSYFAAQSPAPDSPADTMVAAFRPEYTNRDAYISAMDDQGVEAALVMPTHAIHVVYDLRDDIDAAYANLRALNRYMEEDWGYAFQDRIYGLPLLALFDVQQATAELERVLERGARAIALNTGPVFGRSPGDRMFDPFWALANEAAVPIVFHIDYFGYHDFFSSAWGEPTPPSSEADVTPFQWLTCAGSRPMMDMMASLVLHNLFGRFPNLNIVSLSNGATWVKDLRRLDALTSSAFLWRDADAGWPGGRIDAPPTEIIREHLYVAPFVWDNFSEVAEYVGVERIVMASDYPHPDGFPIARDYESVLKDFSPDDVRAVMRDNFRALLVPQ